MQVARVTTDYVAKYVAPCFGQPTIEAVAVLHHQSGRHSQDCEGPQYNCECLLVDVVKLHSQAQDDKANGPNLRQVDCGKTSQAFTRAQQQGNPKETNPAHQKHNRS